MSILFILSKNIGVNIPAVLSISGIPYILSKIAPCSPRSLRETKNTLAIFESSASPCEINSSLPPVYPLLPSAS